MRIHIHVANVRFNCAFPACNKSFKKFSAFKTHCYRHKEGKSKLKSMPFTSFELTCHVDSCQVRCETLNRFYQHLKTHIREGRSISCPFQQRDKSFSVVSTFTAHVSRKHSDCLEVNLIDSVALPHGMNECTEQQFEISQDFLCSDTATDGLEQDTFGESVDEDQFLRHPALFYLKLQSKCLIPSSTVQIIVDHLQEIHEMSHSHLLFKLRAKNCALVSEADINTISEILKVKISFRLLIHKSLKLIKKERHFLRIPSTMYYQFHCLGTNEAGKECFSQYVSIKETIGFLLQIDTVTEHCKQVFSDVRPHDVLHDVWNGSNLKGNKLLNTDVSSLSLILYQDALEVANPLGSGRKKHKLLCVYATLADIPPNHRSRIDQVQLVLICREQDFKYFGQD